MVGGRSVGAGGGLLQPPYLNRYLGVASEAANNVEHVERDETDEQTLTNNKQTNKQINRLAG